MKVKAPSQNKVGKQGVTVGSAVVGGLVSNGVSRRLPGGTVTKIGLAALAAIGAASISGTGTGADATRGALLGVAIEQAGTVAYEAVSNWVSNGETSKAKEIVAKMTGLAGGHDYQPVQYLDHGHEEQGPLGNAYPQRRIVPNAHMIG